MRAVQDAPSPHIIRRLYLVPLLTLQRLLNLHSVNYLLRLVDVIFYLLVYGFAGGFGLEEATGAGYLIVLGV